MKEFDKIKKARELLGLNQKDFAEKVGVTQKDVSLIESGNKKFIPNKYIDFLMDNDFDINSLFNDKTELGKLQDGRVTETSAVYKLRTDKNIDLQEIPLYDATAIAGLTPIFNDLNGLKPIDYLHIPNAPKSDGAIYATGDSMYPLIKSGDIVSYKVVEDVVNDIFWGQMYILDLALSSDDLLTIKYVKKGKNDNYITLVSANQHHQDKEIHISKIRGIAHVKTVVRFP